jgi:hypothetical protein
MALSKEAKDALAEHFKNRDLYDPSKEAAQEVVSFTPKGISTGGSGYADGGEIMDQGPVEAMIQGPLDQIVQGPEDSIVPRRDGGMSDPGDMALTRAPAPAMQPQRFQPFKPSAADPVMRQGPEDALVQGKIEPPAAVPGGAPMFNLADIKNAAGGIDLGSLLASPASAAEFSGPSLSADTQTARGAMMAPPSVPTLRANLQLPKDIQAAPHGAATAPARSVSAKPAPAAPAAGGGKLQPDQFDALIKALTPSTGQRMGMGAMQALAGLADAIETGVARTNGSNFQKNLTEQGQKEREDLINALRAKYETKFKGRELSLGESKAAEEARHNKSAEQIGAEEAGARLSEAKQGLQQNALEAMGRLSESGGVTGRVFGQPAAADHAIKALAQRAGLASGQQGPVTVHTKAEWAALPKGTHYVDPNGKPGVKK